MNIVGVMQWCEVRNLILSISNSLDYRIRDMNNGLVLVTSNLETLQEYCHDDIRSKVLPKGL